MIDWQQQMSLLGRSVGAGLGILGGTGRRFGRLAFYSLLIPLTWASAPAEEFMDIHYGPDEAQVLDLHLPPGGLGPTPFLVFFHGGAFVGGDKKPCAPRLVVRLLQQRIAVACANYRVAPRVTYPAPMTDGARAIQWLRAHSADFNLNSVRVAVMGMSAGAGVAQWVAFHNDLADPAASDPVLRQSTRVSAVVIVNAQATYDISVIGAEFHTRHFPNFLVSLFGASSMNDLAGPGFKSLEEDASPIAQMHAGEPPLLAYYTSDAGTPLLPDSWPETYLHHPAQGALIEKVAKANGAVAIVHSGQDYPGGLAGFLDEAADYLKEILVH